MDHDHRTRESLRTNSIAKWTLIGFLLVAGYFLVLEHRAHLAGVLGYLPFLLLLGCGLMHLFMHHGHRDHGDHRPQKDKQGKTSKESKNEPL